MATIFDPFQLRKKIALKNTRNLLDEYERIVIERDKLEPFGDNPRLTGFRRLKKLLR